MRQIIWMGSSKKDLTKLPVEVKQEMGFALYEAHTGGLHPHAKPFKGAGSGVYEIVTNYDKNTFRAVYVVNIGDFLYVLHVFQKKSHTGIKTPKEDLDIISQRLKAVKEGSKR